MKTQKTRAAKAAQPAATPFPFSVGFPLSIRADSAPSLMICGANRGLGHPILCEVPKGPHAELDAASIVKACSALVNSVVNPAPITPAPVTADSFNNTLSEIEETRRGQMLVNLLYLKQAKDNNGKRFLPSRYDTTHGNKTALGLYRTILRIVLDGK